MVSSPITSWQIEGEKQQARTDFIFLGSKFTVDSDYSYEIKMLAHWKEIYDKSRQSVKKQRRYFADKMLIVKAMVFLVVMYRCENRAIKKALCQRIGPFELWCWRRLLRVS